MRLSGQKTSAPSGAPGGRALPNINSPSFPSVYSMVQKVSPALVVFPRSMTPHPCNATRASRLHIHFQCLETLRLSGQKKLRSLCSLVAIPLRTCGAPANVSRVGLGNVAALGRSRRQVRSPSRGSKRDACSTQSKSHPSCMARRREASLSIAQDNPLAEVVYPVPKNLCVSVPLW